jgi:hypothetical protein
MSEFTAVITPSIFAVGDAWEIFNPTENKLCHNMEDMPYPDAGCGRLICDE